MKETGPVRGQGTSGTNEEQISVEWAPGECIEGKSSNKDKSVLRTQLPLPAIEGGDWGSLLRGSRRPPNEAVEVDKNGRDGSQRGKVETPYESEIVVVELVKEDAKVEGVSPPREGKGPYNSRRQPDCQ